MGTKLVPHQRPRASRTPRRRSGGVLHIGRDLLFVALLALYVVVLGQNWGVYAAAAMLATYRSRVRVDRAA